MSPVNIFKLCCGENVSLYLEDLSLLLQFEHFYRADTIQVCGEPEAKVIVQALVLLW